jgi:hypothetical protein
MNDRDPIMCPAHRCKPGSKLLGVRQNDGTIAILPQALPIDESFIEKVKQHPIAPERRFRFTNKCIEGGCKQWNGTGCKVAEEVVQYLEAIPAASRLPACPIRSSCRWYVQKGLDGCKICSYVQTEVTEKEIVDVKLKWE